MQEGSDTAIDAISTKKKRKSRKYLPGGYTRVQEDARVCKRMQEDVRVYERMREDVRVCESVQEDTRVCERT